MFIELTKTQLDILTDRLNLWDCILDCLGEESGSDPCFPDDVVLEVREALENGVRKNGIDLTEARAMNAECCNAILLDCVDGSTVYSREYDAVRNGDTTPLQLANIQRSGDSLAEKISKATGIEVRFPHH